MIQVLLLSYRWDSFLVSLFLSIQFFFPWVAGCHLMIWDVFHKTISSLFFSLLVFQQLRSILICKDAFQAHLWQKLAFSSPFFYFNDLSSILSSGGIVMLLSSLIISYCEDRVLFMLIHLTGVLCHLFKCCSSYHVFLLLSVGVLPKLYQSYSFSI